MPVIEIQYKEENRIFPRTFAGDQIRIIFKWRSEAEAFVNVVNQIAEVIHSRFKGDRWSVKREAPIKDFHFNTSLEAEIAREYMEQIKEIVGLEIFLPRYKDEVCQIVPLPPYKK